MSHEVDSMAYSGSTPWHGLGTSLAFEERFDVRAAFAAGGLTWEPSLGSVYTGGGTLVPNAWCVQRSDNCTPLGIVGDSYKVLGNCTLADALAPIVNEGLAIVETVGSLRGGADVWALLRVSDSTLSVSDDKVTSYILAHNNHIGRASFSLSYTAVRVVCANTLSAARKARDVVGRVRHTASASIKVKELGAAIAEAERETARAYDLLRCEGLRARHFEGMWDAIGIDAESKPAKRVESLAMSGIGNHGATLWDLYNGITQYETHERGRSAEGRLIRQLAGGSWSERALDYLVSVAA